MHVMALRALCGIAQVFKCIVTGVEYFSDAKKIEDVLDEEGNPTGLVKMAAAVCAIAPMLHAPRALYHAVVQNIPRHMW